MEIPSELRYTKTHEWAKRLPAPPKNVGGAQAGSADEIVVGITAHAQEELRDVVFVELPKVGKAVKQGEPAAVIESVKAAFDIYAPVSGTIARVNEAVAKNPQLVNQDCYGQAWLFAVISSAPSEWETLLTAESYGKQLHAEPH
jgi:glycine cleavage system H protein